MINTVLVILVGLYLLDMFNITETFKDQIGSYGVCADCGKAKPFCCCANKNCKWVQYKYPHYYGLGTWGYHYGEPYYWRCVEYPYPGTQCDKKKE